MSFIHEIEFDPKKAQSNQKKHGVSFDDASAALLDPLALLIEDLDAVVRQGGCYGCTINNPMI